MSVYVEGAAAMDPYNEFGSSDVDDGSAAPGQEVEQEVGVRGGPPVEVAVRTEIVPGLGGPQSSGGAQTGPSTIMRGLLVIGGLVFGHIAAKELVRRLW